MFKFCRYFLKQDILIIFSNTISNQLTLNPSHSTFTTPIVVVHRDNIIKFN